MEPKAPTLPRAITITAAQCLADLPAITSSLLDRSNFITKKLTTLPSDVIMVGLQEYRALVCRELASADSRTPGVFEQAAKEEHDFKNAQKVQLEILVDEVKDLIQKAMEALQMVVATKPIYSPNIGDERITENLQATLLSPIAYHQKPARREHSWHPLDEHNAEQRMEWEQLDLDLGSRLDLLEVDDRLAEADLETLRCQIGEMEKEKVARLEMIRDLKVQWVRKEEEEGKKEGGEEAMVREEQALPARVKSEDEDKVGVDDNEPWIA